MSASVSILYLDPDAHDDGLGCAHGLAAGLLIVLPFWAALAWMIFA